MKKLLLFLLAFSVAIAFTANIAMALPALQLGPGGTGTWNYDLGTQTWIVDEGLFDLNAYANPTKLDGGNGNYAWATSSEDRNAYLVASAVPNTGDATDVFDVTVSNDGIPISFLEFGWGSPPLTDTNSLAPHDIFDTYFEIYQFQFNGNIGIIPNTQPNPVDPATGKGYTETFGVTINSLADGVDGVHFDLYTLNSSDQGQVLRFAPFSHDAESSPIPEPATMLLLGTGLFGLAAAGRRKLRIN